MKKLNYSIFYYRDKNSYLEYPLGIVFVSEDGTYKGFRHIIDFSFFKDAYTNVDVDMVKELLEDIKEKVLNDKVFRLQLFVNEYTNDFYFDQIITTHCDDYNEVVDFLSISILKIVGSTFLDDTLYENVSLKEMLETLVACILQKKISPTYYWRNGDGEYMEIEEVDLNAGRFKTIDGDFSEYDWELEKSNIYKKIK